MNIGRASSIGASDLDFVGIIAISITRCIKVRRSSKAEVTGRWVEGEEALVGTTGQAVGEPSAVLGFAIGIGGLELKSDVEVKR